MSTKSEEPELTGEEAEDAGVMETAYELVTDMTVLESRLKQLLAHYNESVRGASMDLVFFRDAVIHIIRVI